jgi:hypothetical protein
VIELRAVPDPQVFSPYQRTFSSVLAHVFPLPPPPPMPLPPMVTPSGRVLAAMRNMADKLEILQLQLRVGMISVAEAREMMGEL